MNNSPATSAPVIGTKRTILRAHQLGDFEAYAAMWTDPVVTRFIGGKPRTREESWMRFLRHAGLWSLLGYGFWAIEE
ncbi:N-acetyltransferase, partial [Mesorhizobium sp. M7D.F.Ca.US.004.03.1.1]